MSQNSSKAGKKRGRPTKPLTSSSSIAQTSWKPPMMSSGTPSPEICQTTSQKSIRDEEPPVLTTIGSSRTTETISTPSTTDTSLSDTSMTPSPGSSTSRISNYG